MKDSFQINLFVLRERKKCGYIRRNRSSSRSCGERDPRDRRMLTKFSEINLVFFVRSSSINLISFPEVVTKK